MMKLPNPLTWFYCANKDEGNDAPREVSTIQRLFPQVWHKQLLFFYYITSRENWQLNTNAIVTGKVATCGQTYPSICSSFILFLCAHDLFIEIICFLFVFPIQFTCSFAVYLMCLDLGLSLAIPTIIIPSLIGVNKNPDETIVSTSSQASWIG